MKYTLLRIIGLLLAGACCFSALTACDIGKTEKRPDSTKPSQETPSAYADLSPAELYRALFEAEDYYAVAQLDVSKAPDKSMLRKVVHKDEGRLLARTESYDGTTAKRSTAYLDLDRALRYTKTDGKWGFEVHKGGKEALEESLTELLKISEKIPTDQLFKDENYEKADENGCASLKKSVLESLFGEYKSEVTYTKEAEPDTYTLYATVLQKGERHTLTLTVRLVDATVELPKPGDEEEPEPPVTTDPPETTPELPPEDLPQPDMPPVKYPDPMEPPFTDVPEVDVTDAKALIDRADSLLSKLDSFTIVSDGGMGLSITADFVSISQLQELKVDITGKRVQEIVSEEVYFQIMGAGATTDGVRYYDQDVYMLETDGVKEYSAMDAELLDAMLSTLTSTIPTDLSIFKTVEVYEQEDVYGIALNGLKDEVDPYEMVGDILGEVENLELSRQTFQVIVEVDKNWGVYRFMLLAFHATADIEGGYTEIDYEMCTYIGNYNCTEPVKPSMDGYVEVPLESLIG